MDFIYTILNASVPAFSNAAVAIFLCAMVLYFIAEFKTRSTNSSFSLGYWLKDNWINLLASLSLFILYNYSTDIVYVNPLFMIAFGSNYLIDVLITYRAKRLKK